MSLHHICDFVHAKLQAESYNWNQSRENLGDNTSLLFLSFNKKKRGNKITSRVHTIFRKKSVKNHWLDLHQQQFTIDCSIIISKKNLLLLVILCRQRNRFYDSMLL